MKNLPHLLLAGLGVFVGLTASLVAAPARSLDTQFATPPDSARPHTWWHWMNGNVTLEGITADLEAMKRVGVGGAQIFTADCGIPVGPVKFMSPEWSSMIQHAAKEANRLGIELCLHNCAGWSSSGGPWNTPPNAMQRVTTSELRVTGPQAFSAVLPQPPTQLNHYRDIAVFAFPTPGTELVDMKSLAPKVTTSVAKVNGAVLLDGNPATRVTLPLPSEAKPQFVQLEFERPFTARTVTVVPGSDADSRGGVVQVSDDGKTFRNVKRFGFGRRSSAPLDIALGEPAASARFYRVLFTSPGRSPKPLSVADVDLSPRLTLDDIADKCGLAGGRVSVGPLSPTVDPSLVVSRQAVVNLTSRLKHDGRLDWDVPAGNWILLRVGHTPTGKNNHPAPADATGPECDKMSKSALDAHWAGMMKTALDAAGPLAGKSLNNALIDSYEVGGQNWTPAFREEFQKRRGYDPLPFLPTFTGRILDNPAVSERFLWDVRRTIADLFAENYFGHFKTLCDRAGLQSSLEPYGGPFDALQSGASADIPMGEFWVGRGTMHSSLKLAASVGHIYGRPVIGAESFTAKPPEFGRWQEDPYALKALGDRVFCEGINRYIFHRYAMQPWTNRFPGMTMGQWGSHFDRTSTWWEQSRAWLTYVARCQYLLQQGRFVADAAYFCGESAPSEVKAGDPALPPGYDFDALGTTVLADATVQDGQLVLKSGMRYRVLLLPPSERLMTPGLLRQLRGFVAAGLTLVGPPPVGAPGLTDYPQCDIDVKTLAAEMWGKADGSNITENVLGKGRVVWGQPMTQVFAALRTPPDFEAPAPLTYIHRVEGDTDLYFVANPRDKFNTVEATFRISGRVPELWNAETGAITRAPVWHEKDGRTTVTLAFEPAGSVFVVFRQPTGNTDPIVAVQDLAPTAPAAPTLEIRNARYEAVEGSAGKDVTAQVVGLMSNGVLKLTVNNTLFGDTAPLQVKQLRVQFTQNGTPAERIVREKGLLDLAGSVGADHAPRFELVATPEGRPLLRVTESCSVEARTASGKTWKAEIRDVPAPVTLSGPWTLAFPPNWGAPAQVILPQLISWPDHSETGIRYFSGTATYTKEIDIPADALAADRALWLNLGRVKNIAEVSLNGKPLGILWKPPFRANLTPAAQPGKNQLEIKVTNLWPNRLIGDEQLPADCDWEGIRLKAWPQWLLEGKPSPSGRLTFTTWHHWTREMSLLESGLLGPVTLHTAVTREMK